MARDRTDRARRPQGDKPVVVITGAAGNLGQSIGTALARDYRVVGIDRDEADSPIRIAAADIGSGDSLEKALRRLRDEVGDRIASVIHLAAYFDFSGEPNALLAVRERRGYAALDRGIVCRLQGAEVARPARFLNVPLGLILMVVPFVYDASAVTTLFTILAGAAVTGLSVLRGGRLVARYGTWTRWAAV